MSTDLIRYDLLVQEALKGVVKRVLGDVTRDGLPGEHHFYISFKTEFAGVRLSPRLREKYPDEMTIVLQHQYDRLEVGESAFEVGLSFSNIPERLRVPYDSLTGFFDPSVQFGLKFETNVPVEVEAEPEAPTKRSSVPALSGPVPKVPKLVTAKPARAERPRKPTTGKKEEAAPDESPVPAPAGEVVSLDAFRKKP